VCVCVCVCVSVPYACTCDGVLCITQVQVFILQTIYIADWFFSGGTAINSTELWWCM